MSKQIILLSGFALAGKSTVASHLVSFHGFQEEMFARPIYEMICAMYNDKYTVEDLQRMKTNNECLPHSRITVRKMLQTLGTEWARFNVGEDIWARLAFDRINQAKYDKFVISDCRFRNEYTYFVDITAADIWDGTKADLWFVNREQLAKDAEIYKHASEIEAHWLANSAVKHLYNNVTKEALYSAVDAMMGATSVHDMMDADDNL